MNSQVESQLKQRFLEFKRTSTKIGLEEALVQFKSVGQQDWKFEVLCELFYIQANVQHEPTERANKNIRGNLRLLNNDSFLRENGVLVFEVIELYDDIEIEEGAESCWKYLLEGFVHISTRCDLVKGLTKNNEFAYKEFIDQLLQCVHKLNSIYAMQLSEMIFKIIEEYPDYAFMVRFKLVEMQILPDLITRLTVIYCRDIIEFLNGIFYGKSTWFLAQSVNSGHLFIKMKQRVITEIESYSSDLATNHVAIASAMRALAGIVGYFGIKLLDSEVLLLLKVLGQTYTERLVQLSLCLILISADQFLRKQKELSLVFGQVLQSEISEMPLLILVYFQTDAIQQIEDNVRSVLAMQVPIPKLGLFEIQKLFRTLKTSAI
ncbi:uncharacterized protein EV154DRAFT_513329 [Mucor mucedo]|uniref:uncharacterized protein n=1 Tax=Mucor mucedo TaxID=29922 RepID=UPI002220408A|nr:uncharacterized protein EV154DRAFT_513329 [Mucor mucedo]KAI7889770.1 hypothetical protein EV154DRAFT_513329 [Mucor mucedo]